MVTEIQGPVCVLGAGTMGRGIAHVSALAGFPTRLFDVSEAQLAAARQAVARNLQKGVDRGKVSAEDRDRALANLSTTPSLEAAADGADLVIEAVPERIDLKHEVLAKAAGAATAGAILATNTSSLSIDEIAAPLPDPGRVLGMHFFNPVHIMKLLEIVVGKDTRDGVREAAVTFGTKLGKSCIVVKNSPGFATSRLGLVIGLEAIRMVEEGVASPEDIDKAMELGYGFPMGPLRLTDLVGLDVRLSIAEYLAEHLPEGAHFRPPKLLREMVAAGKLGKKSGEGFYRWDRT